MVAGFSRKFKSEPSKLYTPQARPLRSPAAPPVRSFLQTKLLDIDSISISPHNARQKSPNRSMDIPPPFCPNCLDEVPWRRVSSNENGNRGRVFASCKKTVNSNTSIPCNFFQWYPGSRPASQSVSPTLPSASQLQPSVPLFTPLIQFQPLTAQPDQVECKTNGCKSTRIRKGCPHQRRKNHCRDEGGCASHANLKPKTTNAIPSLTPHSFATQPTATPPLTNRASSHPFIPPCSDACHERAKYSSWPHSHMVPVFTERWAIEHRLREDRRKRDEERLVNARKAKHTVFVYAWVEDGFTWPLLVFNDSLLSQAGMADAVRLNLFRPSVGMWSIIKRGLVMDLTTEGNRVFVKTLDFYEHAKIDGGDQEASATQTARAFRDNAHQEDCFMQKCPELRNLRKAPHFTSILTPGSRAVTINPFSAVDVLDRTHPGLKSLEDEQVYPEHDHNTLDIPDSKTTPKGPLLDIARKRAMRRVPMSYLTATNKARMGAKRYTRCQITRGMKVALNLIVTRGPYFGDPALKNDGQAKEDLGSLSVKIKPKRLLVRSDEEEARSMGRKRIMQGYVEGQSPRPPELSEEPVKPKLPVSKPQPIRPTSALKKVVTTFDNNKWKKELMDGLALLQKH
ncbi:unnamed protein product [Cyclocybe aegerita]|uniref:GRF-type domain-containing protein n=1 Tax=Cyclocybe aegerita TaxID=1973307 RepID=A0A8S0XRP1_CYCAE|nr:unnamed protein product [Cyclocybe aegerita]